MHVVITKMLSSGGLRRRLMDLGFSEGEALECLLKSPLGDPTAYLVRGSVIALRSGDAAEIMVRQLGDA